VILIVDDELGIRTSLREYLAIEGYRSILAANAREALDILETNQNNIKVVICDLKMPEINGLDLVRIYKKKYPKSFIKFIMITGFTDLNTMRVSFKEGVIDYLNKPLDYRELKTAVENGLKQYQLQLEKQKERDNDLKKLLYANSFVQRKYLDTIELMLKMLEIKDERLYEHGQRVYKITNILTREMGLSVVEVARIKIGAILHDIGKISIPHNLIIKQFKPSQDIAEVKKHSQNGYYLVQEYVEKDIAEIILHHHEQYNGQGYPLGLLRNAIPLGARVIAIPNYYDYLRSKRYGLGLPLKEAIEKMSEEEGKFDPEIFRKFIAMVQDIDKQIYDNPQEVAIHY